MIEWPEKIESLLPSPHYKIEISIDNDENRVVKLLKN